MSQFRTGQLPDSFLRCIAGPARAALGKAGMTFDEAEQKRLERSERDLQNQIADYLRVNEIVYLQSRMDRKTTGRVGWPDFTFAVGGRACAVEVKRHGAKPTDEQVRVITGMVQNGWMVRVVNDLDGVRRLIEEAKKRESVDNKL